jgi:hypothetical protein
LHHPAFGALDAIESWSQHITRQDRMGYPLDGLIEGPSLPQSVWRYKWLIGCIVLFGILGAFLFSATQPTR